MSDEEKQAIKNLRKILFTTMQANECGLSNNDFKTEIKTYTDILGLIEKQQAEIEQSNKVIDKRNEEKLELASRCLKKDKIIDEMAIQLAGLVIWNDTKQEPLILGNVEEVKEYFKKKVEGI